MNKTSEYDFTILVPLYNEEENIPRLEKELGNFLKQSPRKACVLFVNDCSKDNSLAGVKEVCARNQDMYYISLEKNTGLTGAMKAGFDFTESPLVGYIDADLQTNPEDFNLLLPHTDAHQLVMGIRANRKDSFGKRLQSKIANGFRRAMTHDGATDTGCPLKVLHTDYARRVPMFNGMHRFLPALIQLQHGTVMEVPVRHYPRTAGVSKYNLWNRLISPFVDCFAFRWMKKRYINYSIGDKSC